MILSGSTKVDRVGIDLRNDTKIFKGVITGLGGASQAVEYVFSKVRFTPDQLAELTNMSFNSNQKIAINALSPVRNLFVDIRKVSTRGIRNNAFNGSLSFKSRSKMVSGTAETRSNTSNTSIRSKGINKKINRNKKNGSKKEVRILIL
jgi:hypothetical protein